jgi:small neutral amino acid transporter SnatA (MarC family)
LIGDLRREVDDDGGFRDLNDAAKFARPRQIGVRGQAARRSRPSSLPLAVPVTLYPAAISWRATASPNALVAPVIKTLAVAVDSVAMFYISRFDES